MTKAGMQAIIIAFAINSIMSILGIIYAKDILILMGSSVESAEHGFRFTQIMIGSSLCIMLLFLINGIFRGAGNAAIAMKSLWIANICNIILCPVLINGFGPIPAFGLVGAALATTIGRSIGVLYQVYHLFFGNGILKIKIPYFAPDFKQIRALVKIASTRNSAICNSILQLDFLSTISRDNWRRSRFCRLSNRFKNYDVFHTSSLGIEQCLRLLWLDKI